MNQQPQPEPLIPNPAAVIALTAGIVSLFVLPAVLGSIAVAAGLYGETHGKITGHGRGVAILGGLLGAVGLIVAAGQTFYGW